MRTAVAVVVEVVEAVAEMAVWQGSGQWEVVVVVGVVVVSTGGSSGRTRESRSGMSGVSSRSSSPS